MWLWDSEEHNSTGNSYHESQLLSERTQYCCNEFVHPLSATELEFCTSYQAQVNKYGQVEKGTKRGVEKKAVSAGAAFLLTFGLSDYKEK